MSCEQPRQVYAWISKGLGCSQLIHRKVVHEKKYGLWLLLQNGTHTLIMVARRLSEMWFLGENKKMSYDNIEINISAGVP